MEYICFSADALEDNPHASLLTTAYLLIAKRIIFWFYIGRQYATLLERIDAIIFIPKEYIIFTNLLLV